MRTRSTARRSLVAACVGNAVEWYDYAVFAGSAAVLATVLTPGGWAGFTTVFAVFATSCLARPAGSLAVGWWADRSGRRPTLVATIVFMSVATFAIGLIPPWSAIGAAAPLALFGLRLVQAAAVGGEISSAVPYVIESSRPGRRGLGSGWYLTTVAIGLSVGLATTAVWAAVLGPQEFQSWGWRVPFLLALPLGFVAAYIRFRVAEAPQFRPAATALRPLQVLRGRGGVALRCFVIGAAFSATFNVWFIYLPGFLAATGRLTLTASLGGALCGLVAAAAFAPLAGRWSDQVGRRPLLIAAGCALVVGGGPLLWWVDSGSSQAVVVGSVVVGLILVAFVVPAFIAEQFPSGARATGIGLTYGVSSAVIGGTAPLIAAALARPPSTGWLWVYLAALAALAVVAAVRSPETARMDPDDRRHGTGTGQLVDA